MTQDWYIAMLEEIAYPELDQVGDLLFQQDVASLHSTLELACQKVIGYAIFLFTGKEEVVQLPGIQEAFPDVTPLNFFSGVI